MSRHQPKKTRASSQTHYPNPLPAIPNETAINVPVSANIIEYNMAVVPAQSYELLRQENSQLKQELTRAKQDLQTQMNRSDTLASQCDTLRNHMIQVNETITQNNTQMDLLRRENDELKAELATVKLELLQLKLENKNMSVKIDDLTTHVNRLTSENQSIRDELRDEKLSLKLTAALQDLNADDELEKNMKRSMKKLMAKLRNGRNQKFHYIDNTGVLDYHELATYKKQMTLDKLNNLTPEFISGFEKSLGKGLIQGVIQYLKQSLPSTDFKTKVDEEDREIAEDWWTD